MAGFGTAWPSAAYDEVMESMTDWAFSCPISVQVSCEQDRSFHFEGYPDTKGQW